MNNPPTCQPPINTNRDCQNTCSCKPNCGTCKIKKVDSEVNLCKYQQPPIPISYKPCARVQVSKIKLDDQTVYRDSYLPCMPQKCEKIVPPNTLATGEGKVSKDTCFNTSYIKYEGALPAKLHVPCKGNLLGTGPMQDATTQKCDYVPKPIERTESCRPPAFYSQTESPLSSETTNRASFGPVDTLNAKTQSCRPCSQYGVISGKTEYNTTQSLSYLPYKPQGRAETPWSDKKPYREPEIPMLCKSIYDISYQPVNSDRQGTFKPKNSIVQLTAKMQDATTYRNSYQNCELGSVITYRPQNCLGPMDAKMSGDTIHKMAYQQYENALPAAIIRPCTRKLGKEDPMENLTIHRQDYIPQKIDMVTPFRPPINSVAKDCPFSGLTTNRLSYTPYDGVQRAKPMIICGELRQSSGKVEDKTTNNLSYMPYTIGPKEDYPWIPKNQVLQPSVPIDGITIQALSYQLPGSYVACSKNDPDCIPCPKPETAVQSDPCCENCCCESK